MNKYGAYILCISQALIMVFVVTLRSLHFPPHKQPLNDRIYFAILGNIISFIFGGCVFYAYASPQQIKDFTHFLTKLPSWQEVLLVFLQGPTLILSSTVNGIKIFYYEQKKKRVQKKIAIYNEALKSIEKTCKSYSENLNDLSNEKILTDSGRLIQKLDKLIQEMVSINYKLKINCNYISSCNTSMYKIYSCLFAPIFEEISFRVFVEAVLKSIVPEWGKRLTFNIVVFAITHLTLLRDDLRDELETLDEEENSAQMINNVKQYLGSDSEDKKNTGKKIIDNELTEGSIEQLTTEPLDENKNEKSNIYSKKEEIENNIDKNRNNKPEINRENAAMMINELSSPFLTFKKYFSWKRIKYIIIFFLKGLPAVCLHTLIFGVWSYSDLYLTESAWLCCLLHIICNILGLPLSFTPLDWTLNFVGVALFVINIVFLWSSTKGDYTWLQSIYIIFPFLKNPYFEKVN